MAVFGALALGVGLAVVPVSVTVAGAAPALYCGETITTNITMRANLTCRGFSGDGLILAGSGITLNLGGHTITGTTDSEDTGILVTGTKDKVQGGTLRDFYTGIYSEYAYRDTFTGLTFDTMFYGVDFSESEFTTVSFNHFYDMTSEAVALDSAYLTVIEDNIISFADAGIGIQGENEFLTIRGNQMDPVFAGIAAFYLYGATISQNRMYGFGGIGGNLPTIRGKAVNPNAILPDCYVPDNGIDLIYGATYLSVTDNTANDFYDGILIGGTTFDTSRPANRPSLRPSIPFFLGATATLANNVTDTNFDGVLLEDPYTVAIINSRASHNVEGIWINNYGHQPGASVKTSTATDNYEYGFWAANPVPSSKNVTSGNGSPAHNVTA